MSGHAPPPIPAEHGRRQASGHGAVAPVPEQPLSAPVRPVQIVAALIAVPRLLQVRLLLARHGIAGSQRRLQRRHRPVHCSSTKADFDATVWHERSLTLRRAATRIPGSRCLAWSLALWHWLGREGIAAELCIGVRQEGATSRCHAWVEHEGRPIGEAGDVRQRFTPVAWSSAAQVLAGASTERTR